MKYRFLFLFSFLYICSYSINDANDKFRILINLKGSQNNSILYLASVTGEAFNIIDSVLVNSDNKAEFSVPEDSPVGFYKIIVNKENYLNFIFNNENIELRTYYHALQDSLQIISSKENTIFYNYLENSKEIANKIAMLGQLVMNYPKTDKFYNVVKKEFNNLQKQENTLLDNLVKNNPETYAAKYLSFMKTPEFPKDIKETEINTYLRKHFFDNTDFSDSLLLNSDAIPNKIVAYLSLYMKQNASHEEQEKEFIKAIDGVLPYTNANDRVYEYCIYYLINGFEKYKYEEAMVHIGKNYVPDISCVSEKLKSELEERISGYNRMSLGNKVSDFILPDINNEETEFYNTNNKYTLLVFWASWCPHCETNLEELNTFYNDYKNNELEIITISIDTSRTDWEKIIINKNYKWKNLIAVEGWNSRVAKDYNLYATPTMFFLDRNKNILSKPITTKEFLKYYFENINN